MLEVQEKEQLRKVLRESINEKFVAGGSLMIIKDGEEVFYHEDGYADIENRIPVKRDSIFRLYSMSKPVTATAVMILMEQGKIDLYDPVSKYIPGFRNQKVAVKEKLVATQRDVTLKDLLSMTAGLVYGGEGLAGEKTEELFEKIKDRLYSDSSMSTLEIADCLGKCPLAFQPGVSWEYGTSADVLGAVIEVVSGKTFGAFLKDEIFAPLGMTDTGFWVPEEKRARLVKTYTDDGHGGLALYTQNHLGIMQKMDKKPTFESGGAGLVSTIDDYAKFTDMLMNGGIHAGVRILRPRTVRFLTTATLNSQQQSGMQYWNTLSGYSYGNLMRVLTDCTQSGDMGSLGEYGWDGWLGAYFANCPADKLTILLMVQKTDHGTSALTRKLRNIILSTCIQ